MSFYVLSVDVETRSLIDLNACGVHIYARHPSTKLLCCSYSFDGGKSISRWQPWLGKKMPSDLHDALMDRDVEVQGWNAISFERHIFGELLGIWIQPERFHDTMVRARSMALPASLELCARILEMPIKKADDAVMRKWMKPLLDGSWANDPTEYETLCGYCDDDVRSEGGIAQILRPLSVEERQDCAVNERINDRGLMVDISLARAAQRYAKDELAEICDRLNIISQGVITSPKQYARIKKWLVERLPPELQFFLEPDEKTGKVSFDAATREEILGTENEDLLVGETRELVELVHDGGKASTAKFVAMQARAGEDQRVRGAYTLNGAAQTGRYSSHGLQVHNFIRASLPNIEDVVEAILRGDDRDGLIRAASFDADGGLAFTDRKKKERIKKPYNVLTILSRTLRPSIIAPPGKVLVWRDWSAIEARILPWLSAENSASQVLEVFASGKDIYIHQAAASFGVDEADVTPDMRQGGKVQCIAEGQLVLTQRGLVPIEQVEKSDKTWDGFRWTYHDGVVYKGIQDVWEYQGLVATIDHVVFTEDGRTFPLGACAGEQVALAKTGTGRTPIRLGSSYFADGAMVRRDRQEGTSQTISSSAHTMHQLPGDQVDRLTKFTDRSLEGLQTVLPTESQHAKMADPSNGSREESLRESERSELAQLWGTGDTFQFSERTESGTLGAYEPWPAKAYGDRPREQRGALRRRELALDDESWELPQYTQIKAARRSALDTLLEAHHTTLDAAGAIPERDTGAGTFGGNRKAQGLARYRGKARVYDIVNAGPDHRFTVSNVLVHNCLSFGFGGGAGAGMRMARAYGLDIDERTAEGWKNAWRQTNPWAARFWKNLEVAAFMAVRNPDTVYPAGRVAYLCSADVLWCMLPSGRMLAYPFPEIRSVPGRWGPSDVVTCIKGSLHPKKGTNYWPRMKLWGGIQAEGITQGEAASLLRWSHRELDANGWPLIGHTHDENLLEVDEDEEEEADAALKDIMNNPPYEVFAGLPLASEGGSGFSYSK